MFDVLLKGLIEAQLGETAGEVPSVTVSIDLSTPQGVRLAELAKKLLIPTTKRHASGLEIKTGMQIQEAADDYLEALRQEFGDELMQELADNLRGQQQAVAKKNAEKVDQGVTTEVIGGLAQSLIPGLTGMSADEKQKIHNATEELKQGRLKIEE
jgi:hypothetical protein